MYSKLADTKAKVWNEEDEDVQKPDEDSIAAITEKTRQALEKITQSKVSGLSAFKKNNCKRILKL